MMADLSIVLPGTQSYTAPLKWYADPIVKRIVTRDFADIVGRAVGFYQTSKWFTLKMFLASDMTVKDLQTRLGLRRPGLVADMLFKYSRREEQACFFMDLIMHEGLDCRLLLHSQPTAPDHPDNLMAEAIPNKLFSLSAQFSEEEVRYVFSPGKIYWPRKPWSPPRYWLAE